MKVRYINPRDLYLKKLNESTEVEKNEYLATYMHQTNTFIDILINNLATPEMLKKIKDFVGAKEIKL